MADRTRRMTPGSSVGLTILVPQPLVQRLGHRLCPALLVELRPLAQLPGVMRLFVDELVEVLEPSRRKFAGVDRRPHGTPRLVAVPAVAEAAFGGKRVDIGERGADVLDDVPQLELAHSRRVDEHARAWQHDELTRRARVPAAAV